MDTDVQEQVKPKKKAWRKILNVVIYFVIIFGIVFGLPRFLTRALDTPYPMAAITSGSMWPALKEGDLVFVQGIQKEDLKVGDIVVYKNKNNNTFTIHRVVKLNPENFVTKGDGNFNEDEPALYPDLVGRSLTLFGKPFHIPYLGSITVFASNLRTQKTDGK